MSAELLKALAQATARQEWTVSYWPQRGLVQGRVIGAAAQVEWASRSHGSHSQGQCLPLLAQAGLIEAYTRWVFDKVCDQLRRWQEDRLPPTRVSVELGPEQCAVPGLAEVVAQALEEADVSAASLAIAVPASVFHNPDPGWLVALDALRTQGVEMVVRGFGTDPVPMESLCRHPVDRVQLGASLVQQLVDEGVHAKACGGLIELAHGLGWQVLAEDVTTAEQLGILMALGCDQAQGAYLGTGLDGEAFGSVLLSGLEAPGPLAAGGGSQRTLLLVDDEENIVSSLKRLFRRDGYRILTANSGAEGLSILAANEVHVILSDQRMPGMTGVEFLREAKVRCPDSVRITLSGYTDLQSIIDAVNEGAVYKFLTKPWEDARLREHVAQAFEQFELASENVRLGMEVRAMNRDLASVNQRLERMVVSAHERRRAMQSAAGASRDMLDLIPVSIFGVGSEGVLAYANRCAISEWPEFASALGEEPEAQLAALMARLDEDAACLVPQGVSMGLAGRRVTAWKRTLTGAHGDLGSLIILHASPETADAAVEVQA